MFKKILKVLGAESHLWGPAPPSNLDYRKRALLNTTFSPGIQTQSRTVGSRKFMVIQATAPKPGDLHLICPFKWILNHVFQN